MPKSKIQKILTTPTDKESQDARRYIDFSSVEFHSQATKI